MTPDAPARLISAGQWGKLNVQDTAGAGLGWLDEDSGHYATVIEIPRKLSMKVGSLGQVRFAKGSYVNIGTMKQGLVRRVARHLTREKNLGVWHVDRLTRSPATRALGAVLVPWAPWTEHTLSSAVGARLGLSNPIPGFSIGDCKAGCVSHLWYSPASLSLETVAAAVSGACATLVETRRADSSSSSARRTRAPVR